MERFWGGVGKVINGGGGPRVGSGFLGLSISKAFVELDHSYKNSLSIARCSSIVLGNTVSSSASGSGRPVNLFRVFLSSRMSLIS